jgi:hypothetical protein
MTQHAYPNAAMVGAYLRAGAGLVPTAAILAVASPAAPAAAVLAGLAGLFAVFGLRTALRHGTRIELTEAALRATGPLGGSIAWSELDDMKLAYYSTRRDRRDGWMQLKLHAGGASLSLDSRIDGFAALVERAAQAAARRGVPLSAATAANLEALGIAPPPAVAGALQAGRGVA